MDHSIEKCGHGLKKHCTKKKLKVVICTSSLDLGVDFRPVETVIQVGSPKSISRFYTTRGPQRSPAWSKK
jgi:ATP-dependent Lhr-like helicase